MNKLYKQPRMEVIEAVAEAVQQARRYPRSGRLVKGEAGRIAVRFKVPKRFVLSVSNGHRWSPLMEGYPAADGKPLGAGGRAA